MGEYYEVNLQKILETGDFEDWLYFYLFFRKEAFVAVPDGSFVDTVVKASIDYGAVLEDNLKNQIFDDVFIFLAKGFYDWRRKNAYVEETQESLKEVFEGTLILLYRLLFILYAEYRDLLPVKEKTGYWTKSLDKIKHEIEDDKATKTLSDISTDYWDDLVNLFHIIDIGDSAFNVPKYNGGLFSVDNKFLAENKVADKYLVDALYFLTTYHDKGTGNRVFIDYKSLGVRQLGSIYEGLLEFHLNVAKEELAVVKEKGKEKYVPVGKITKGQKDTGTRFHSGDLYLENTKAERKATGSYYTPHFVVEYIVRNTIGPLFDDLERAFADQISRLKRDPKYRGEGSKWKTIHLKKFDPAVRAMKLKICDPSMGSGHFLVAAVDYVSQRVYDSLTKTSEAKFFGQELYESPLYAHVEEIRAGILSEMEQQHVTIDKDKLDDDKVIIRRMVMKRCIFGVDLNYMAVELAKLSLWLNSFTIGAPLSFLDHHLRWGNSLIGSAVDEVRKEIQSSLFGSRFTGLISAADAMIKVGELTDSTVAELHESHQRYLQAVDLLQPYKSVLDIWTSQYFGNHGARDLIDRGKIDPDRLEVSLKQLGKGDNEVFDRAKQQKQNKRFFHWELEFPEVFYASTGKKEDPGFDAVIGNPPYDVLAEKETGADFTDFSKWVKNNEKMNMALKGKVNLYELFFARCLELINRRSKFSMIVPMTLLADFYSSELRKYWLENYFFEKIEAFPQKDDPANRVFKEAKLPTVIFVTDFNGNGGGLVRTHPGRQINDESPCYRADIKTIRAIDNDLYPVPLVGQAGWDLLNRIVGRADFIRLENIALSNQGEINETNMAALLSEAPNGPVVLRGGNIQPFELMDTPKQGKKKNLDVQKYIGQARADSRVEHHKVFRIGYQRNSALDNYRRIIAGPIPAENFCFDSVSYFVKASIDLHTLLALLNSSILEWRFRLTSTNNHVNAYELHALPIRRISFTTPLVVRNAQFSRVQDLYLKYDQTSDWSAILSLIADLLEKKHQPDSGLIKKHNLDPVNYDFQIPVEALWQQSDVIHDFLAFLAKEMIAMIKVKQEEKTRFLKDFQRTIGRDVEDLTNKTLIKDYHKHSFDEVLGVLGKNRRKLQGFNPRARADRELLEAEFSASVFKLDPIKTKIQANKDLIDQIAYKLYDLTKTEIKIVEESLS